MRLLSFPLIHTLTVMPGRGNLDLSGPLSFLGQSQFEVLAALSVMLLVSTQTITTASVRERILISSSYVDKTGSQIIIN